MGLLLSEEKMQELAALDAKDSETTSGTPAPSKTEGGEKPPAKETVTYAEEVEQETADQPEEKEAVSEEPEWVEIDESKTYRDPATGQFVSGRELKNERLRQADYTRKTQELAAQRRDLELRRAELDEVLSRRDEIVPDQDEDDGLDPDDPLAKRIHALEANLAQREQAFSELQRQVAADNAQRDRERLERIDREYLEKYPVLDEKILADAGRAWVFAVQSGHDITYDQVVQGYVAREEARVQSVISGWKTKHRVQPAAEPAGVPAGMRENMPSREEFMKEGLADRIAREDAEAARARQR